MKKKICKIILVLSLIIAISMLDFIVLGKNIAIGIVEALENQNSTTNIENVEFDIYFKEDEKNTYNKEALIQQGTNLFINLNIKEAGSFKDGKIKLENTNFNLQEIKNQYVKNIDTQNNEIEFNQMIAGNQVELEIPITFKETETINKEYLSQEIKAIFTGTYQNTENREKEVIGEKTVRLTWAEEQQISINQGIDKYIALEENSTLIQQTINTQIINNKLVQGKVFEIEVQEVQNALPKEINILLNGEKLSQDKYVYDETKKTLTIKNQQTNHQEQDEYKIIYKYPIKMQNETLILSLNSKLKISLLSDEIIEKQDNKQVEIHKTDNAVSIKNETTDYMYKGYLYAGLNRDTNYQEKIEIEVSSIEKTNEIKINQMKDYFIAQNGTQNSSNNSTNIRNIKFNKENLKSVLGEDFHITVSENGNQTITEITKDSTWNENGEIEVSLEEKNIENIEILFSQPTNLGTLKIEMNKYIKGNTGYSKEQLKNFTNLLNTKIMSVGEKQTAFDSKNELKDTHTEASLEISNTNFSTLNKNENIQILAVLKADSEQYDLWKNPHIEIRLPEELQQIDIQSFNILYGEGLNIKESIYNPETKIITVNLEGEQIDFRTTLEQGIQIVINADLTFKKDIPTKETAITMLYNNENTSEQQYETKVNLQLNAKQGAILYNNIVGYDNENTLKEGLNDESIQCKLDSDAAEKKANIHQTFINNYEKPINQITILGNLTGENVEAKLTEGIATTSDKAKIYYSEKENATIEDDSWKENKEELSKIQSYKIEIQGDFRTFRSC